MWKITLDGTELTTQPDGLDELVAEVKFEENVKGLLTKTPTFLVFKGDGYERLLEEERNNGFCSSLSFVAEKECAGGFVKRIDGELFISEVVFNETKCTAEANIFDNSFQAKIQNNQKIQPSIRGDRSKNDVAITRCPFISANGLRVFLPASGIFDGTKAFIAYDLKDVITYLVAFMSDGTIGFRSDWYDNLPAAENLCLVTGVELRLQLKPGSPATAIPAVPDIRAVPEVSYEQLFNDFSNIYNLVQLIETDNTGTFVRWEQESFIHNSAELFQLDYLKDVERSFDSERLFSRVKMGSQNALLTAGTMGHIRFFDFDEESFYIQSICNVQRELDLRVNNVQVDSNAIEEVVFNGNTNFDDKLFVIQYTRAVATLVDSTINDPFGDGGFFYNQELMNFEVIPRYNLQGSVAKYLPDDTTRFRAERVAGDAAVTTDFTGVQVIEPLAFGDDSTGQNEDPGGNYDNVLFRYTAPDNGSYTFRTEVIYEIRTQTTPGIASSNEVRMKRFDSGATLLETRTTGAIDHIGVGQYTDILEQTFFLNLGDYVEVSVEGNGVNIWRWPVGSIFETTGAFNGGGVFHTDEGNAYRVTQHRFKRTLTEDQITDVLNEPFKRIAINSDGLINTSTNIRELKINLNDNSAEWLVLSNLANT